MDSAEIVERIKKIISSIVKHDNFEMSAELTANDVAGWDSLSHIKIINEIEKDFNIKFKLKDLNRMNKMGNVIELVTSKIQQQ
jgi:acyl carrier protein